VPAVDDFNERIRVALPDEKKRSIARSRSSSSSASS